MTARIMVLDVQEIRRLLERRHVPVQPPHPLVNRGIPGTDIADVALEVLHVHGIEADDGHEETNVDFCKRRAEPVGLVRVGRDFRQMGFGAVQGGE